MKCEINRPFIFLLFWIYFNLHQAKIQHLYVDTSLKMNGNGTSLSPYNFFSAAFENTNLNDEYIIHLISNINQITNQINAEINMQIMYEFFYFIFVSNS